MSRDDVVGDSPNLVSACVLQIFILAPWLPGFGRVDRQPVFVVLEQIAGDGDHSFDGFNEDRSASIIMSRRVDDGNVFIDDVCFFKKLQKMISLDHVIAADEGCIREEIHITDVVHVGVGEDNKVDVFGDKLLSLQLFDDELFIRRYPQINDTIFMGADEGNRPAGALTCIPNPTRVSGLKDDHGSNILGHDEAIVSDFLRWFFWPKK